jgi:glycosyltransferase involved in cell wall biosynthesis
MRVLHISPGRLFGGVETLLVTIARCRELCPEMAPEFAVCFPGRLSNELQDLGAPFHMLGEVRASSPLSVWRARRRLRDLLLRRRFDAVVCHMPWVQAIFAPVVRKAGIKLTFYAHSQANGDHWTERWAALTRPDIALCVSRFVAASLSKIYPGIATEVLYCPVMPVVPLTPAERMALRSEAKTAGDTVVIVQACRLEAGKGHRVCLDALTQIKQIPGWICWQVGGPQSAQEAEYFDGLREEARQLGIGDRVYFWGQRSDVARLLAASDIYCQPNDSFLEGFGIVFVEAISAGLPVVTSGIGAAPEVIDEACGFLLQPGDPASVAAALERLISAPAIRERLGAAGRARAQAMFTPAAMTARLQNALAEELKMVPMSRQRGHTLT